MPLAPEDILSPVAPTSMGAFAQEIVGSPSPYQGRSLSDGEQKLEAFRGLSKDEIEKIVVSSKL